MKELTSFCFASAKFFQKCNKQRSKGVYLSVDEEVNNKRRNADDP